jgi:hypothetical protein
MQQGSPTLNKNREESAKCSTFQIDHRPKGAASMIEDPVATGSPRVDTLPRGAPAGDLPMPFTVTDVQPTPNPNAAKFILDRAIVQQPTSFFNAAAAKDDPLASKLFAIEGVTSVLMLGDFVTINKRPEVKWKAITERVQEVLQGA